MRGRGGLLGVGVTAAVGSRGDACVPGRGGQGQSLDGGGLEELEAQGEMGETRGDEGEGDVGDGDLAQAKEGRLGVLGQGGDEDEREVAWGNGERGRCVEM